MTDLTDIKSRLPYSGGPFLSFWLRSLGLGKYEAAFREKQVPTIGQSVLLV